jgi:Cap4 dsDNA endonuclease
MPDVDTQTEVTSAIPEATSPSPLAVRDGDPGDATQFNFEYQYGFGVILLTAAYKEEKTYISLWCEHHDDYICERTDKKFDAYQIKTSKPEDGAWHTSDEDFYKTIKRFIKMETDFPGWFKNFYFVSNTECSDSQAVEKIQRSPRQLIKAAKRSDDLLLLSDNDVLNEKLCTGLKNLAKKCDCSEEELFKILKRVILIHGPSRRDFESRIAHDHLGSLPPISHLSPANLNRLRDKIMNRINLASSLRNVDSSKDWACVDGSDMALPEIHAKRIKIDEFETLINEIHDIPFQYSINATRVPAKEEIKVLTPVIEKKFSQGGIREFSGRMIVNALSTESRLISLALRKPDKIDAIINQLENVVLDICDEAKLEAQLNAGAGNLYGPQMLSTVKQKMREICATRPAMVYNEQQECLYGLAGILTGECQVWWSDRFDLESVS